MRFDTGGAFIVGLMLSACAVVGPLTDRTMTDAPHQACAQVNGIVPSGGGPAGTIGEVSAPPVVPAQCFALAEEAAGVRREWSGGALEPGRTLIAVHRAGPGCGGTFSHLTVSGASAEAGRMELATWDLHARPGHQRVVEWREGFGDRSFALADIGSVLMNPAGARITVQEGAFDPRTICFRSY